MRIAIIGLSITSSWGNGHAVTYRGLARELCRRGHDVLFLERDVPWYAGNRDLVRPSYARAELYDSLGDLKRRFTGELRKADLAIVGSYVPDGVAVAQWMLDIAEGVTAFYDIDTPVTLAKLQRGECEYLCPPLIPHFDLYLSFTGGPILERIERQYGARAARVLYCAMDPEHYYPENRERRWDMAYMGTYSDDRQPVLDCMMLEPARRWPQGRFMVSGPLYPESIVWPGNVERVDHVPPSGHRAFYNSQRFCLNVTRADMRAAGYSPSVRLFEAAACGIPVISDYWCGLETVFEIGSEILVSSSPEESLAILRETSDAEAAAIGTRARARALASHTAAQRALKLEHYYHESVSNRTTAQSLLHSE